MVDIQTKLLKFKNLNLTNYINENLPKYERSILLTDKNTVERVIKDIDTEIFKAFLLNSDSLLEVLYTYESVQKSLSHLDEVKEDLRKITYNVDNKEDINFVDKNRLDEFRNILENFSNDTESFDTGTRVLVHFDVFEDQNANKHIFLLTNDILIIGRIQPQVRKYQLVNAFSYSIIDIQIHDSDIYIVLSQSTIKYSGDKEKIKKFYLTFKDLIYSFSDEVDYQLEEKSDINNDMLDFLVFTEQYSSIEDSLIKRPTDIAKSLDIYRKEDLFLMMKVFKEDSSKFVVDFLNSRFITVIGRINKVMSLSDLINHVFEVFYDFNREQQELLREVNQGKVLLMLENQIIECFKLMEERIFNRRYYSDDIGTVMNQIRDKLVFDGFDFSYLTEYFENKRRQHNKECLVQARKEIDALLSEMICK